MSEIKTVNTAEVADIVDSLIKNPNIKLSVEYNDSFYTEPKYVIRRTFYFFDKPNSKYEFPKQFEILNHDARLVQYEVPRGNLWFFADEKNTTGFFIQMDEKSKLIFDKVKTVLHNRRAKAR